MNGCPKFQPLVLGQADAGDITVSGKLHGGEEGLVQKNQSTRLETTAVGDSWFVLHCSRHEDRDLVHARGVWKLGEGKKAGQLMKFSILYSYHVTICYYI